MTPAAIWSSQASPGTYWVKNEMYSSSGRPAPPGASGMTVIATTAA
jgi:hypothetical protein